MKKIKLDGVPVYIFKTSQKNAMPNTVKFLKDWINKGKFLCIYLTFHHPAKILKKTFKSKGINLNKILFIDAITRLSADVDFEKNLIYVDSPKHLTDLSIVINNRIETNSDVKKKFVFVYSLSDIMTYNSEENTLKFLHSLSNKLRLVEVAGIFLVVKGGNVNEVMIEECGKHVDKVIAI